MEIAKPFTKVDINKHNNAFMRLHLVYRDVVFNKAYKEKSYQKLKSIQYKFA